MVDDIVTSMLKLSVLDFVATGGIVLYKHILF